MSFSQCEHQCFYIVASFQPHYKWAKSVAYYNISPNVDSNRSHITIWTVHFFNNQTDWLTDWCVDLASRKNRSIEMNQWEKNRKGNKDETLRKICRNSNNPNRSWFLLLLLKCNFIFYIFSIEILNFVAKTNIVRKNCFVWVYWNTEVSSTKSQFRMQYTMSCYWYVARWYTLSTGNRQVIIVTVPSNGTKWQRIIGSGILHCI